MSKDNNKHSLACRTWTEMSEEEIKAFEDEQLKVVDLLHKKNSNIPHQEVASVLVFPSGCSSWEGHYMGYESSSENFWWSYEDDFDITSSSPIFYSHSTSTAFPDGTRFFSIAANTEFHYQNGNWRSVER